MPSGHHMLIECVGRPYRKGVGRSPAQQVGDIERECRVTLAVVFPRPLAVYPDGGAVEDSFKLDTYRRIGPGGGNIEAPTIPGNTAVARQTGRDLPGVRNIHILPVA